jgi:O-antigen/teichoic acid export membrane protein
LKSPKKALLLGAAWGVGMRWIIKGIGFINTVIMARLLAPQDYGVVAMAMLVVGLIQAFTDFGTGTALLRMKSISKADSDSAWTLSTIQGLCIAVLLVMVSPFAQMYFKEPRIMHVLWTLAGCIALSGSANVGMTLARKELNFSLEFRHAIICKLLGVLATIISGYFLRDYRALVIGVATGYVSGWAMSYVMHPYRPRWDTSKIAEIWALTKWLLLGGIAGFFLHKIDQLIAARVGNAQQYGLYNVGADLGQLPTGELGPAMLRAFLPVLSSIQGEATRVENAVLKTIAAVNTITIPVGLGFAAVAVPATGIVLGARWIEAVPYVACFALISTIQFAMSPLGTLLVLRGHTRAMNSIGWGEFFIFLLFCAVLVPKFSLLGLAWARLCSSACGSLLGIFTTQKYCQLSARRSMGAVARPLAGALIMWVLVRQTIDFMPSGILGLIASIAVGMVFYSVWTLLTWHLAGRPEGLESTVMDQLRKKRAE